MIELCTLTGVDGRTDLEELIDLAAENPGAEFGILYSLTPGGDKDPRYPSHEDIWRIVPALQGKARIALHICGKAVRAFVGEDQEVIDLAGMFSRIQLNFSCRDGEFPYGGNEKLIEAISNWDTPTITQHNRANETIASLSTGFGHHILFDASGGRGIPAGTWPEYLPDRFCGFAGGVGPETIHADLDAVERAAGGNACWIDMESKLRTDGYLDLQKCRTVLSAFSLHRATVHTPKG